MGNYPEWEMKSDDVVELESLSSEDYGIELDFCVAE